MWCWIFFLPPPETMAVENWWIPMGHFHQMIHLWEGEKHLYETLVLITYRILHECTCFIEFIKRVEKKR